MWKQSFRARPPSKSDRGRCENEAFVRDLLQRLKMQDVKEELSCETSFKKWKWKMWKQSLRARLLSNFESWRCKNEAFVRGVLQTWKVQMVKTKPELSAPMRGWSENNPGLKERVPQPPAGQASRPSSGIRSVLQNTAVRAAAISQKRISREISFKKWKCKMWKLSFCARPPSKSESWRCENEAFVRDLPEKSESLRCESKAFVRDLLQKVKAEDVKTKLSCETSLKKVKV